VPPSTAVPPEPEVAGEAFTRPAGADRDASDSSTSRVALGVLAASLLMIVTRGLVRSRKA
jgi:hypothetical protein